MEYGEAAEGHLGESVGGISPPTGGGGGGGWGGTPRGKKSKIDPLSCNVRHSELIFLTFSRAIKYFINQPLYPKKMKQDVVGIYLPNAGFGGSPPGKFYILQFEALGDNFWDILKSYFRRKFDK